MFLRLYFDRRLADGSTYRIRPSGPHDRELLVRCFESLSLEARRLRFFTAKQALTPEDLDRFCAADGHDHIAFAAVRIDATGRESEPLGFARCLRLTPGGEVAEFSVATVDGIQGQGVGSALLSHLIPAAQRQGIRRFRFDVLPENTGMRRLAQCFCGDAKWVDDGTLEYDCGLPEPIPADPATWSKRPASRPVVTALPRGVTLYLSPAGVVASCAATWGLSLARYLAGTAQPPTRLSVIGWRGAAQRPASPGATRPKLHHRDPSVRPRLRDFGRSS